MAGEEEVESESAPGDSALETSLGSRAKAMAAAVAISGDETDVLWYAAA